MHILICSERFLFRYGMDRVFLVLAKGFCQQGHRVTLLAHRFDAGVTALTGATTIELPAPKEMDFELHARDWLKQTWSQHFDGEHRPDIVLLGGWPFFSSIPFLRTQCENTIFSDHGMVPLAGQPESLLPTLKLLAVLRHRYLGNCRAVVAVSEFIAQSQSRPDAGGYAPCKVIHNGADHLSMDLWRAGAVPADLTSGQSGALPARVDALRATGRKILLSLGRWEPGTYKGSDDVFTYARSLRKAGVACSILILAPAAAVAVPKDCDGEVIAIGYPDDGEYAKLLRSVDAGVCFSQWEGFNLPVAEMQWSDRPAFALDVGAHPEVICHPYFLAQDIAELAAKTVAWLATPSAAVPDFEERCRRFREQFSWSGATEAYLRFFAELLANPAGANVQRPDLAWWDTKLVIDVTNSVRDPANTGVIRVTRRLSRTLQQHLDPIFVIWLRDQHRWVFPTLAEYEMLSRFNGPRLAHPNLCSPPEHRIGLEEYLATQPHHGGWVLLPETIQEQDAAVFRQMIESLGLHAANVFYDAIPLIMPELCNSEVLANHARYMRGLASLDVVIPISEFSANCLREHWTKEGVSGAKVVPNLLPGEFGGADRIMEPPPAPSGMVEMLCVSTLEPRKNHRRLIEACLGLDQAMPGVKWRLTFVGNRYAGKLEIAEQIESLCQKDPRFRWLGIVDDQTLAKLYTESSFTVYPSLIEGYGMPIMESVWFGRPCICHQTGVMAELAAGGGCLTTQAEDPVSLRAAIVAVATDQALYRRLASEATRRPIKSWREYTADFLITLEEEFARKQAREWEQRLFQGCLLDGWQMSDSERAGMYTLLSRIRPSCAIEIGTYKGGSLSLISQFSQTVFSIDIDPEIPQRLAQFKNVSFLTGPSTQIVPALLAELDAADIPVEFVLVDGDHSEAGVRNDLNCILAYRPKRPFFVVMHDSYNPICRRGIMSADWALSPYLQWLDTDFIPGRLTENGSIFDGQVWGGLALAYFTPQHRFGPPRINSTSARMQALILQAHRSTTAALPS